MDLRGCRIWKDGDVAARLISFLGVLILRSRQRRVCEIWRIAEIVDHLGDTNSVTSRICAVRRDEPLDATLVVAVHLSRRHRPELGLWMRDKIGQSP